jgi:phage protein D
MAAAVTYPVRAPGWALTYRGVAITSRIESMVLGVTYTTHAGGASPELEFEIEDRDKRWQGPWFPARGDLVALAIGYAGESLVSCGSFQVDEVELRGPGDVMHLRCLAAFITDAMRTPNSVGYENQTLLGIAGQVAKKYGFTLLGAAVNPDVSFARVSQNQETDLEFLHRLANEHNYEFSVRGTQMVFYSRTSLEQQSASSIVHRADVTRFSFKAKTRRIYKAVQVSYQNPATKQLVAATATATPTPPTGDTLKIVERCENGQQAALKAAARLHRENMIQTTGELSMPGTTAITAGRKITISGFGVFDGNYMVDKARHELKRASGFTTDIEIRSVN